jgi:SAM-dependent methyltransferase
MKLPGIVRTIGKRVVKATPILRRHIMSSSDHRVLDGIDEARRVADEASGWLSGRTVARQERAYRGLLAEARRGEPRLDLRVAADAVTATRIANPGLLDVGCGSGEYCEVFDILLPGKVRYTGVDYSEAMIARARTRYPAAAFELADATRLPFGDAAFDIVFNGVSLMHIIDYPAAIREAARVAARSCIFHTVPVFEEYMTTFMKKYAYGAPVVEIIFGKNELMSRCRQAGLRFEHAWPGIAYDMVDVTGHHSITETLLFSKG